MTDTSPTALDRLRSDLEDQHYRLSETIHEDLEKTLKRTRAALQRFEAERDRILEEMLDRLKDQHAPLSGRLRESLSAGADQAAREVGAARSALTRAVEELGPQSEVLSTALAATQQTVEQEVQRTFRSIDLRGARWIRTLSTSSLLYLLLVGLTLAAGVWAGYRLAGRETVPHFVESDGRRYVVARAGTEPERHSEGRLVCEVD